MSPGYRIWQLPKGLAKNQVLHQVRTGLTLSHRAKRHSSIVRCKTMMNTTLYKCCPNLCNRQPHKSLCVHARLNGMDSKDLSLVRDWAEHKCKKPYLHQNDFFCFQRLQKVKPIPSSHRGWVHTWWHWQCWCSCSSRSLSGTLCERDAPAVPVGAGQRPPTLHASALQLFDGVMAGGLVKSFHGATNILLDIIKSAKYQKEQRCYIMHLESVFSF